MSSPGLNPTTELGALFKRSTLQLMSPEERLSNIVPSPDALDADTNGAPNEASIGRSVSHGCIRMKMKDAEELFSRVKVEPPVEIIR